MLETYHQEITKKRRAARFFWFLVFSFAAFLYFFFQGYYPSIDFSLKQLFGSGARRPEVNEFVKSFGIINVTVTPNDATLIVSSGLLGNDEKRMVNYGTYDLSITREGYLSNTVLFHIDRETPYYIDTISLLEKPQYARVGTGISTVTRLDDTHWAKTTASGMILLDMSFSGEKNISRKPLTHIGEGYYLSQNALTHYDAKTELWEKKTWSGSVAFIDECDRELEVRYGNLWCPENGTLLKENGKIMTGITSIGKNYLRTRDSLITEKEIITLAPSEQEKKIFIEKNTVWYTPERGIFIPLMNRKSREPVPLIDTGLDEIRYADWIDGTLVVFGKKGADTFVTYITERMRTPELIPFPDIPLEAVRLTTYQGNTFIKTKGALLFQYKNSRHFDWIIDGEILAMSPTTALYIKNGVTWKASWLSEK